MPPAGSGEPNRQARTQYQPRSSIGSPRWASSQSSTPRSPSGPTRRLPRRKSPCTTVWRGAAGRWASSQRSAELEGRERAGRARRAARASRRAGRRRASAARRRRGCGGSRRARRRPGRRAARGPSAHSSSRSSLRAIVSPSRRSITIAGAAERGAVVVGHDRRAPARPAPRPARSSTRLALHARARCSSCPARRRWRISALPIARRRRGRTPRSRGTRRPRGGARSSTVPGSARARRAARSSPAASSASRSPMQPGAQQYWRTVGVRVDAPRRRWGGSRSAGGACRAALPVSPT